MTGSGQWGDWLPFWFFLAAMISSGTGALVASANRLRGAATFFAMVFAASIAAALIYGM